MSLPFAIERRLSLAHLKLFQASCDDPRMTVSNLHKWLGNQGYKISRSAVGNYRRHRRDTTLFRLRPMVGVGCDADARRALHAWTKELSGDDLTRLVLFTAFLMNLRAAAGGPVSPALPGRIGRSARGKSKIVRPVFA